VVVLCEGVWREEEEVDFLGVSMPLKVYSLSCASASTIWHERKRKKERKEQVMRKGV
jgi:hypothetical protein